MKNVTLTLIAIAALACLPVGREASAGGYKLVNPPLVYEHGLFDAEIVSMSLSGATSDVDLGSVGGGSFTVDSFFDVFTELAVAGHDRGNDEFPVESFFDVFVEMSVDGGGPMPVMLTGPVTTKVTGASTAGLFDTEIVSMSLSGSAPGGQDIRLRQSATPGLASPGGTTLTDLGGGLYHIDSFFDVFTELSVDGGDNWAGGHAGGAATNTPARIEANVDTLPPGVPAPTQVPGKEYSHHLDIDAPAGPDPMQNLAWDGTGNAWDTFDYNNAINHTWPQGTNVDAIANIQDYLFHEVVNDEVTLLATIDEGVAVAPAPTDYENIHYQTPGAASVAGIWARGVVPTAPLATSDIHTAAIQARQAVDPRHLYPWINPTGIEVWGPEVSPGSDFGGPGTGDDANMFSTNADWRRDPTSGLWMPNPAVWRYDPTTNLVSPYIMADAIANAIGVFDQPELVNLDGMMIYDVEKDGEWGTGDSIMFTILPVKDASGATVLDGGEIWVWNYDDGPFGAAFLNHGGITWDTANVVSAVFPNVMFEENIGGLEAVPEPATLMLLALGGASLLGRRRRR